MDTGCAKKWILDVLIQVDTGCAKKWILDVLRSGCDVDVLIEY